MVLVCKVAPEYTTTLLEKCVLDGRVQSGEDE